MDERTLAKKNLDCFLQKNKIKYIIRYQKNHNKMIDNCDKNDFEVVIDRHRFRVIKLLLDSGEVEILITDLGKLAFLLYEIQELYHLGGKLKLNMIL